MRQQFASLGSWSITISAAGFSALIFLSLEDTINSFSTVDSSLASLTLFTPLATVFLPPPQNVVCDVWEFVLIVFGSSVLLIFCFLATLRFPSHRLYVVVSSRVLLSFTNRYPLYAVAQDVSFYERTWAKAVMEISLENLEEWRRRLYGSWYSLYHPKVQKAWKEFAEIKKRWDLDGREYFMSSWTPIGYNNCFLDWRLRR